jgi:hypothetical protein
LSRDVSTTFRQAAMAQETGECPLLLLTIDHDSLDLPIRVVNNHASITSRGETYLACAFKFTLPDDQDGQKPAAKLIVDNVDREIVNAVRSLASPPTITAEIVLADTPNVVEAGFYDFELKNVQYDAFEVSGDLSIENFFSDSFPYDTYNSSTYPGVFLG